MASPESAAHDAAFNSMLTEFLTHLATRFPDNSGISQAKMFGTMMNDASSMKMKREAWGSFSEPVIGAIMAEEVEPLTAALEAAGNPILTSMGLAGILADPSVDDATKASMWQYVQLLSVIAHQDTGVNIPKKVPKTEGAMAGPSLLAAPTPATAPVAPATLAAAPVAPAAPATPPSPPDVAKVVEGFAAAMPKLMESFNTMMKDNDGDNPMAQMLKQFMNPNQTQPGVMNNLAANYMEGDTAPVMAQVQEQLAGMSVQDIAAKLKRLERIENKHAAKKGKK